MRGPLDVTRQLLAIDVPHEIVHLPRRIESAYELSDVLAIPAASCLSADLFSTDSGYVVTLVPCDSLVAPALLARAIRGTTVARPDTGEVNRVTDFTAGLVAPVGLPGRLPVVADTRVATAEVLYTTTGDSRTALKIRGADLVRAADAALAELAEPLPFPLPRVAAGAFDTGLPVGLTLR
jgi:prolyl-tRNA editing enzyme YbaK/EbsC (Cys-tRNA(Pro) deacylase)